jgi:hypothetical protein
MPPRKLGEQREEGRRLHPERRDRHEPSERQRAGAHRGDEFPELGDRAAALLPSSPIFTCT